jgi:solute carrier family 25 citrate transporter 1
LGLQKDQLAYRGPIDAAIKIVRQEGITAMWKGLTPTMFRNASNQACNFMSYNLIKQHLWQSTDLAPWQTILTGAMAGAIGPMLNGPADVIKTRLMQQKTVPGQVRLCCDRLLLLPTIIFSHSLACPCFIPCPCGHSL